MNKEEGHGINSDFDSWLQKNNPRKTQGVPDGYFENFSDLLMERIKDESVEPIIQKRPILKLHRNMIGAVAAAIIVLIAAIVIIQAPREQSMDSFAELNPDSTLDYLLNNSSEYTLDEIMEFAELDQTIADIESELLSDDITEDFIDNIDFELLEDLYE